MSADPKRVAARYAGIEIPAETPPYTGPLEVIKGAKTSFKIPKKFRDRYPLTNAYLGKSYIEINVYRYGLELGLSSSQIYGIHLSVHPAIQGMGYAARMISALAHNTSMLPLVMIIGRVMNSNVFSMQKKLEKDPTLKVIPLELEGQPHGWAIYPA